MTLRMKLTLTPSASLSLRSPSTDGACCCDQLRIHLCRWHSSLPLDVDQMVEQLSISLLEMNIAVFCNVPYTMPTAFLSSREWPFEFCPL